MRRTIPERQISRLTRHLSHSTTKTIYGAIPIKPACIDELILYYKKLKNWRFRINRNKLKEILIKISKKYPKVDFSKYFKIVNGNLSFSRIIEIKQVKPTTQYVYDVSVPGYENFLCGFGGIFAHNTLTLLAERELEIKKFVPKPYWQLQLILLIDGNEVIALYEKEKIWKEDEAKKIFKKCKNKSAIVEDVQRKFLKNVKINQLS